MKTLMVDLVAVFLLQCLVVGEGIHPMIGSYNGGNADENNSDGQGGNTNKDCEPGWDCNIKHNAVLKAVIFILAAIGAAVFFAAVVYCCFSYHKRGACYTCLYGDTPTYSYSLPASSSKAGEKSTASRSATDGLADKSPYEPQRTNDTPVRAISQASRPHQPVRYTAVSYKPVKSTRSAASYNSHDYGISSYSSSCHTSHSSSHCHDHDSHDCGD